jgi:hypothetical protein
MWTIVASLVILVSMIDFHLIKMIEFENYWFIVLDFFSVNQQIMVETNWICTTIT